MIGWRVPSATGCLVIGVSFSTEAGTGWRLLAGMLLVFVPTLIVDHLVIILGSRQPVHESVSEIPESYPPEYSPGFHPDDSGNHPDAWIEPVSDSDTEVFPAFREYPQ